MPSPRITSLGARPPRHVPGVKRLLGFGFSLGAGLFAAAFGWRSAAEHILVLVVIAMLGVIMVLSGHKRQLMTVHAHLAVTSGAILAAIRHFDRRSIGVLLWCSFFAALLAFDLFDLVDPSKSRPTLSHLAGKLSAHFFGHLVLLGVWIATGWWVILSSRRPRGE